MFCDKPDEMRIFDAIVEKNPYLDEFQRHYLNLAVWCYINQPDRFREIVQDQERPADDFDDFRKLIESEIKDAGDVRGLEEIQDVD
jgi:hypothetical protein